MAEQGSARKGGEAGASLEDLQADDEFEEFAVDEWDAAEENKEELQFYDDWDDDDTRDDFSAQLRAELDRHSSSTAGTDGTATANGNATAMQQG